jgi:hypothetical protein
MLPQSEIGDTSIYPLTPWSTGMREQDIRFTHVGDSRLMKTALRTNPGFKTLYYQYRYQGLSNYKPRAIKHNLAPCGKNK